MPDASNQSAPNQPPAPASGGAGPAAPAGSGSLLQDLPFTSRYNFKYRRSANERLWALIYRVRDSFSRSKRLRQGSVAALVMLLFTGSALAVFSLLPRHRPDVAAGDITDVLDYTLLSEDFNKLPLDERFRILRELVRRLRTMSADDSAMMAAFAAGITGQARDQLRKNAEKLMVDTWDSYAAEYEKVKPEDRADFLDRKFVEFTKMGEDLVGESRDKPDHERLADGKKDAQRDAQRARERDPGMTDRGARFVMETVQRGSMMAAPDQRSRMARFSRDMTRQLRGQDLNTGKPKDAGGG